MARVSLWSSRSFAIALASQAFIVPAASGEWDRECRDDARGCDWPMECVVDEDGEWAQCIECSEKFFESNCRFWPTEFRVAAEKKCGLGCFCMTPNDCDEPRECVAQEDGEWAQCIECNKMFFESNCRFWPAKLREAAEKKCGLGCNCTTSTDCDGPKECVVQEDGEWAQCIECSEMFFESNCGFWPSKLRVAAEKKCGLFCNAIYMNDGAIQEKFSMLAASASGTRSVGGGSFAAMASSRLAAVPVSTAFVAVVSFAALALIAVTLGKKMLAGALRGDAALHAGDQARSHTAWSLLGSKGPARMSANFFVGRPSQLAAAPFSAAASDPEDALMR